MALSLPPADPRFAYMQSLDEVSASIKAHIPEILQDLQASCEREPWIDLPAEDRLNNLAKVTSSLVDAAFGSGADRRLRLEEAYASAEHGEHRLQMGFEEELLFTEFTLLKQALSRFLKANAPFPLAQQVSVRLDSASSLATIASIRGYHRPQIQARGEWPQTLDHLVDNWPM